MVELRVMRLTDCKMSLMRGVSAYTGEQGTRESLIRGILR